jgi:hypothetical protein
VDRQGPGTPDGGLNRQELQTTATDHASMRRLLIVFLLVLLPLRGWTADAMALGVGSAAAEAASHALCPDHAEPATASADTDAPPDGDLHAHCTACQLTAMALHSFQVMTLALPTAPPSAAPVALVTPAPRRLIKPPIA